MNKKIKRDPDYEIENPESEIRSPGQSPEQHQIINESQAEPEIPNEAANYSGTYNSADVKAFNDKLASIAGKRESKGEPANLVAPAEKNYADPYAQNISSLLKRYQEASEVKSAQENKGGAWSMVVGNALGPEAGRATLQSWQAGADEGVENLDRQQKAATGQIKNDDSLFALARKSRAADPNSPLSKALTEYERKNTGFGKDAAGAEIPGLSGQDALDSGKGIVNPVYSQKMQTERNDLDNQTKVAEGEKNRGVKTWQTQYKAGIDVQLQKMRNATALAVAALNQKYRAETAEGKMANEYGSKTVGVAPSSRAIAGARPDQLWVPHGKGRIPTPQGQKRFQEINESAGKYAYALDGLEAIRREQDPNRLNEMIGAFKTDALTQDSQFRAMAQQADTKWNDNGVLNPGDLVKAIESLGGVDPASFKSILLGNPEIISALQRTKRGLGAGLSNAAETYNYKLGTVADLERDLSGGFGGSGNSGPSSPAAVDAINTFAKQGTGTNVNITNAPSAVKPANPPAPTASDEETERYRRILRGGQ